MIRLGLAALTSSSMAGLVLCRQQGCVLPGALPWCLWLGTCTAEEMRLTSFSAVESLGQWPPIFCPSNYLSDWGKTKLHQSWTQIEEGKDWLLGKSRDFQLRAIFDSLGASRDPFISPFDCSVPQCPQHQNLSSVLGCSCFLEACG